MNKRRLTRAQQSRQKRIQDKRIERSKRSNEDLEQNNANVLGPEQPGLLIAHYGTTLIIENQAQQLFRCTLRQNLGTLVTGDEVIWQSIDEDTGVVVACKERRSTLTRPDKHHSKPIAANVDRIVIVLALKPLPQKTTLDRYLILAETLGIHATIVINKCDLSLASTQEGFWDKLAVYQDLGYSCVKVSTKTHDGITEFQSLLKDHTSILVGQSGVGKSSLLNTLIPDAQARINALSKKQCLGQHTTTASRLYHLPEGGNMIDSPGIHQFDLNHFSKQMIERAYKEFAPYLSQCRFRNCSHHHEPGCALQAAVEAGKIASFRLQNYHTILSECG